MLYIQVARLPRIDFDTLSEIITNSIAHTERTPILQPHQAPPRRPDLLLHGEPRPRLLRREDRQCGGLQAVVEGPEGVQPEEGCLPRG